jgi:hypothetical protein
MMVFAIYLEADIIRSIITTTKTFKSSYKVDKHSFGGLLDDIVEKRTQREGKSTAPCSRH